MQDRFDRFRQALANRRFRWLLLAVAAVAIVPDFAWNTVVAPLLSPDNRYADLKVFQQAAARIAAGTDPYVDFVTRPATDSVRNGTYLYPPFFAWLLQPFAGWTGDERALLVIVCDLAFLAIALVAVLAALRVRDRQAAALAALATMGFFPVVDNFYWGQLSLLLLALGATWFWSYVAGSRWWGAAALGVAASVKLIQAPLLLGHAVRREWRALGAAAVAAALVLSLGVRWLPEYAFQVLPGISGGTGWMGNVAPAGVLMRIVDPGSFTSHEWFRVAGVEVAAAGLGVAVLLADLWLAAGLAGEARERRAVEGALLVASLPLVLPVVWGGHLALQLLPMIVVAWFAIRRRRWAPLALAVAAFALMGPVNARYWVMAGDGSLSYSPFAQPFADLPALGIALGWAATVAMAAGLRADAARQLDRLGRAERAAALPNAAGAAAEGFAGRR